MRGGHLAILRSGFRATKESEVAAGDIVPVSGAQFEETLASASPDVLRAMIREFAQRMMDADVGVALQRGLRGGHAGPGELPQRLPAPGVGHPGRDDRAGDPQAPPGVVLPGLPGAPPPRRAGAGLGRGDQLPAGRLDPAGGEAGRLSRGHRAVQVAGQRDGGGAGRAGGGVPVPAAGPRAVHVLLDRCADPEGPRGRPDGERALPDRDRGERRRVPGDPRHRRDQLRGRGRVAGVPARPGRPRPVRRRSW